MSSQVSGVSLYLCCFPSVLASPCFLIVTVALQFTKCCHYAFHPCAGWLSPVVVSPTPALQPRMPEGIRNVNDISVGYPPRAGHNRSYLPKSVGNTFPKRARAGLGVLQLRHQPPPTTASLGAGPAGTKGRRVAGWRPPERGSR